MLKLGNGTINKLMLGTAEIKKVYLGSVLIHDKTFITATGGTVTESGDYRIHTFLSNGTFEITSGQGSIEYFMIGGGGGAGGTNNSRGNGGDAGQRVTNTLTQGPGAYSVVIGAAGIAATGYTSNQTPGGNSSVFGVTALGGKSGASTQNGASALGGTGGNSVDAGGVTQPATSNSWSPGVTTTIRGVTEVFGRTRGDAGLDKTPAHAPANKGDGGQRVWSSAARRGGNGGSGIVIIRYKYK